MSDEESGPGTPAARRVSERFARRSAQARELYGRLSGRYPKAAQAVRFALAPTTIDRCFALAAQIFITALPMAIAFVAFLPHGLRNQVRDSLSSQLGIDGTASQAVSVFFNAQDGTLRETVGLLGLLAALISATSLTRRLQRLYEVQWSLPPGRMRSSALRWLAWILVWVAVLSAQGPVRSGSGPRLVLGWVASVAMSVGLWWWTPHLLLLRRVGWRALLPTALLTGLGQALIGLGSRAVMPTVTGRSVSEYGPFGLVLSLMTWLLVVATVIVVGCGVGRILAGEEARPQRLDAS